MVKTAVILAAGMGERIRERTGDHPKGFLLLDGKPLIEHSILKLLDAGIESIIIGTGYEKEAYEELAVKYPEIECVYNADYETTGSMYTLYKLKDVIKEDFLLLESDLIYEKEALNIVISHPCENVILASKFTNSGDEVYIEADDNQYLINMSKDKQVLNHVSSELVGITKLANATFHKLCSYLEKTVKDFHKMHYEEALVSIAKEIAIFVQQESNIVWCEVDMEEHWQRAINFIYPLIKEKENVVQKVNRKILLNPGPATTTDTVKYAQIVEDICPREEAFSDVMEFVADALTAFVANLEDYTTVLFSGSGTAAVESILSSVIRDDALLIINNGAYGERMCKIASAYGLKFYNFISPADQAINLRLLETFIQNSKLKISHIAVVHCETSTGLLNDIESLGQLCEKHHLSLIVDAMSAFAAIPIDMKEMNISYLAASSNKNLQGMAGVSFVVANKEQVESLKNARRRNVYLNLYNQYAHFKATKQMQFTPPVQTLYALKQAIIETKWETIEGRYERYSKSWETLIEGITRLGMKHLVDRKNHSKIITSIIEPSHPNYNFYEMHDFFYERGITIYPGKVDKQKTFRVANIGNISSIDMEKFIDLLEEFLNELKEPNESEKI
ncbi:2-aminoethylphosphonate aminotransferase [Oceanobacillus chungangensis]|uniref:2-aminoethylphosphonate--pyruvate transaminase n=1 Tax=Oceanobacillus chungangensis TaxID=1229152 RepID=A0A3D8PXI4_9BACI|nr:2-aminoethylphosphonate--pyruvate transaminase [Oceanobacillus chungangensis]RDW20734.1 2-aminoethylphosphonate--pyruvate transaminase [Oceanobacillus chungangensis]